MDSSESLSPFIPIVHHSQQVFQTTLVVLVGQSTLAHQCEGVDIKTLLMSSFLFLQEYPVCFICLIWIVLEMEGKCLYSCCFMGCCYQDLFNIACSIFVQFSSSFFSIHFVSIHVVHLYSSIDTTTAWKKSHFILLDRSDFHIIYIYIYIYILWSHHRENICKLWRYLLLVPHSQCGG